MRLAMAALADAANVREGMLNVLSAGVSEMWRPEFPSPLGVVLPLLIEVTEADRFEALKIEARLMQKQPDGNDVQLAALAGEIRRRGEPQGIAYVPTVLRWGNAMVPAPGDYYIHVEAAQAIWTDIPFTAHQLPQGG